MPAKIEIPLSINPRELIRGLKITEQEFEGLEKAMKEVEAEGDDLEKALEDNFKDIGRAARRAGDQAGDDLGKGLRGKLGGVGAEVADEFSENFGEAIRSGNPAGAILETFTSLAPALGALGIGAAVVAGLVNSVLQERQRVKEAITGIMDEAASEAISKGEETGTNFSTAFYSGVASAEQRQAALKEYFEVEDFNSALNRTQETADGIGVKFDVVADLITGNVTESQRAYNVLEDQRDMLQQQIKAEQDKNLFDGVGNRLNQDRINQLQGQLGQTNALLGSGQQILDATRQTGGNLSTWNGYVRTTAEQARLARDYINGTRPPDMSQSAYNAERMAAAAISAKATLDQIRDKTVTVNVRVAGATGQGGVTV